MELIRTDKFEYVETRGSDKNLLLLHGLFGTLSNFNSIIKEFGSKYNVIIPILPILNLPRSEAGLGGLTKYVHEFVELKAYKKVHILGNSLGGHIAQIYCLQNLDKVSSLILTGSSGLFESPMGNTWPRREDYSFVKKKTENTFYNADIATKEMVDEIYRTVNDRKKVLNIVITAKSAIRHNLEDKLQTLVRPTLLIWGKNDTITPPFVAQKFKELLPQSELFFIDKCGHAPMMEHPDQFNLILKDFLSKQEYTKV